MGPIPGVAAFKLPEVTLWGSSGGGRGLPHECSQACLGLCKRPVYQSRRFSEHKREASEVRDCQAAEREGPDGDGASGRWTLPGDPGALLGIRGAAASGQGGEVTPSKGVGSRDTERHIG